MLDTCRGEPVEPSLCESDRREQGVTPQVDRASQAGSGQRECGTADRKHVIVRQLMRFHTGKRARTDADVQIHIGVQKSRGPHGSDQTNRNVGMLPCKACQLVMQPLLRKPDRHPDYELLSSAISDLAADIRASDSTQAYRTSGRPPE
jgi:hypothetical protein